MRDLAETYSADWFAQRQGYRPVYARFAEAVLELWRPVSVLDVGCGAGYLMEGLLGHVAVLRGVDGSRAALDAQAAEVRRRCTLRDLARPAGIYGQISWDLVVSVEVAEHLPAEHAEAFLRWFDGAERVLFTAAPPGQGGTGHVNEQPPTYWREAFAARGLLFDGPETERWRTLARSKTHACPWVVGNAMVFLRPVPPAGEEAA